MKFKEFEVDHGNGKEICKVDYMVLFGKYDNEHPELHYSYCRSKGKTYKTIEEAMERAHGCSNAKIWEVAHALDSGDIVFVTEISK